MNKHASSMQKQREENLIKWVGYWRQNPQRFVKEFMGMDLHLFQKILFYMMNKVPWFMFIAARGMGDKYGKKYIYDRTS